MLNFNSFITVINNSIITLTNLKVDNFESKTIREFIGINSDIVYYREGGGKIIIIIIMIIIIMIMIM